MADYFGGGATRFELPRGELTS